MGLPHFSHTHSVAISSRLTSRISGARGLELELERRVEPSDQLAPVLRALLDLIEIGLHLRGEVARHDLGEAHDEQAVDQDAELGRQNRLSFFST